MSYVWSDVCSATPSAFSITESDENNESKRKSLISCFTPLQSRNQSNLFVLTNKLLGSFSPFLSLCNGNRVSKYGVYDI